MSTDTTISLPYGYNGPHLAGVRCAWGCRLIVQQDGYVDFVFNRQGLAGPEDLRAELIAFLNEHFPPAKLAERIGELLASYRMKTSKAEEFVIFHDHRLEIRANTNASYGYCYVACWLKEHAS